jgi:hypothetical protein
MEVTALNIPKNHRSRHGIIHQDNIIPTKPAIQSLTPPSAQKTKAKLILIKTVPNFPKHHEHINPSADVRSYYHDCDDL